jgi:methyltransferase family protein
MIWSLSTTSMRELGSLKPSRRGDKTKQPDFGTYHHTTSAASKKIRPVMKAMFTDAFASLPFWRDEFYKNSRITGIDTFEHASLKRSSLEKAKENARILGFSNRITFKSGDVFRFTPAEKYDIIVSNLVFHNFGKKRFDAYSRLSSWAEDGSFVVIGEWFFSPKTDITYLSKTFRLLREIKPKSGFGRYALLVMSKDSGQVRRD